MGHAPIHRKTKAIGLIWSMIRVLAYNDHLGFIKATMVKGSKNISLLGVTGILRIFLLNEEDKGFKIRFTELPKQKSAPTFIYIEGHLLFHFIIIKHTIDTFLQGITSKIVKKQKQF
jgi:hypothetical protein